MSHDATISVTTRSAVQSRPDDGGPNPAGGSLGLALAALGVVLSAAAMAAASPAVSAAGAVVVAVGAVIALWCFTDARPTVRQRPVVARQTAAPFCPYCGRPARPTAAFCPTCGHPR